jgi:hypothetical protein
MILSRWVPTFHLLAKYDIELLAISFQEDIVVSHRSACACNRLSTARFELFCLFVFAFMLLSWGCGSGGSGTTPPPPPSPDFSIQTSSQSLTVAAGGSTNVQVSITPMNGFSSTVSVAILGLPAGVTVSSPPPFNVTGTAPQTVTFMASSSASLGTFPIDFQATSGSLQHTAPVSLQVQTNQLGSFTVTLNNSELTLAQGGEASTIVGLSLSSAGNSNFSVNFSISGLPAGVQASFGLNPFPFGQPATSLSLTSSSNAGLANYSTVTVSATRTADGVVETATFLLNVTPPVGALADNRVNFIRTDGTPAAAVYDAIHNVVYSANTAFNRVDVISPQSGAVTRSIPAPTPAALALTPDGTHLFVGCNVNQILSIDTTSLQVVKRTSVLPLAAGNGNSTPYYFSAQRVVPASNGKFLLGMINSPSDPRSFYLVEWDPVAGTFTPMNPPGITFSSVRDIAGGANGAEALVVDYGTEVNLAVYDSASDSFPVSGQSPVGQEIAIAANPSGSQFAIIGLNGLAILDNQLNLLAEPSIGSGIVYGMQYSPDGSKLLISYLLGGTYPVVETLDTTSFSLLGVAPAFGVCVYQPGGPCQWTMAQSLAADGTGLVFSSFDHGLVFEDASNFQNLLNLPPSVSAPVLYGVGSQNEAALNTTFATTLGQAVFDVLPDVWFGGVRGSNIAGNGFGASVTAPASTAPAIVNVKAVLPDGWMALAPQAFSYGTEILFVGTTAAPATGNVTLNLVGHGFIGSNGNATTVTIGGQSAKILTAPHQGFAPSSDAFPIPVYDEIELQVPPGTAGAVDITVNGTAGSSTVKSALAYLPGATDYTSTDKFTNILYDSRRNRVYLAAGNKIDVFDANANTYLSPIIPPSVSVSPLFQGLALTPDGSKLLATNFSSLSLEIINPDSPSTATEVPLIPGATPIGTGGSDVAATSTNQAMIELAGQTGSSCSSFGQVYQVDLGTLKVTALNLTAPACLLPNRAQISSTTSGDKVFLAVNEGGAYLWDAATNQWTEWPSIVNNNVTASGDGYWFASDYTSLDSQLVEHTQAQIPEYFADDFLEGPQGAVPGEKMNASGSLLYQPLMHGADVIDVSSGVWLRRIALTEEVQFVQNAMALDEAGNRLFLITNAGLTVLQMDSPPLSIGYLSPSTGRAAGGTTVTIRGSGFQPTATVTFGGISATTTFVDASTLHVITPPLPTAGVRVTISNSPSSSYSLDAAFQAN